MKLLQTESIKELSAALAKAQGVMTHAGKTVDNPYFKSKYADLSAVIDAAKPALAANGLSVMQITEMDEHSNITLVTQLNHSSGEWVRGYYPVKPTKNDPQGLGSALTYARRYAYGAITGVAAAGEDDDGNAASGKVEAANDAPTPFKTAAARKTFTQNTVDSYQSCSTLAELKTIAELNADMVAKMKASGNEHDALAIDEMRKQYALAAQRINETNVMDEIAQREAAFSEGVRGIA